MKRRVEVDPMEGFPEEARPWCHYCDAPIGAADISSPPYMESEGVPVCLVVCARCLRGPDGEESHDAPPRPFLRPEQ